MSAPEAIEHERRFWELTPNERENELARMAFEVFSEANGLDPQIGIPPMFIAEDLRRLSNNALERRDSRGNRALAVALLVAGVLALFKIVSSQASQGNPLAQQVVQMVSQTWWGPAIAAALGILVFDAAWTYFNPPAQRIPPSLGEFAKELAEAGASGETQDDRIKLQTPWYAGFAAKGTVGSPAAAVHAPSSNP
jgi:hypothetical protein